MFSFDLFLFLQTGKHLNYLSIFHIKLSHLEMFKDYENGNEERQIPYNILLLKSPFYRPTFYKLSKVRLFRSS